MTSSGLFRREVLEARRKGWLGSVRMVQPISVWVMTAFCVFSAAALITLLMVGEYRFRVRVVGQLVPDLGLAVVLAPNEGVVTRLFGAEGDDVGLGAGLALITTARSTATGTDALLALREGLAEQRRVLESLGHSQLARIDAQREGVRQQLSQARQELAQLEREIATRTRVVELTSASADRYRIAIRDHFVSAADLQEHEQKLLESVSTKQSVERQATTVRRSIAQLEQALNELPTQRDSVQAATRRDLITLEQAGMEEETGKEMLMKSPVAGLIAGQLTHPGQAVRPGQPLFTLLPRNSSLRAQLLVPSSAVGFIKPGDRVLLRYEAYPYQKFGNQSGRVIRVSRSAINPDLQLGSGRDSTLPSQPLYRVLVELEKQTITVYGKVEPLRPGLVLEADVLADRRKLYEWILDPLYTIKGRTDG